MSEYQEFTGKTVEEALRNAREAFNVSGLDDLDFEILTPGSRGVLGMGAEPARIIAAPRAALGGTAPRREAAAAKPLPPAPPREREERDRGRDRGRGRDRVRGPREGARPPREAYGGPPGRREADEEMGERRAGPAPVGEAPVDRGGPAAPMAARAPASGRERDRPRVGRDQRDQRRGSTLTEHERDEVTTARASITEEREEMQAAEASPEALAAGKEILEKILALMGYRATVTITTGDTSKLDVTGDEDEKGALGALIGRKGERLSALQHLVNLMLSRRMGGWTRVLVDVEDYRGRRERQLQEIAQRAAQRVEESGAMLQLEPMPALERRWIHLALRGHPRVTTQSIGEEPQRRVVILRRDQ